MLVSMHKGAPSARIAIVSLRAYRFSARWIQLTAAVLLIGIAGSVSDISWATRPPVLPVDPYQDYGIQVVADRHSGVVPFTVAFEVVVTGNETVEAVRWDFDSDGTVDAQGLKTSYTFSDPTDYEVTAEVRTSFHGRLFRTVRISGHTALMTITFDDGPQSIREHGLPLLASKGVTATAYIVPAWVGMEWYLQWEEIAELHEAGWVIGSHTQTHPRLTEVDDADLHHELSQSQNELQGRGFPARHLAVPHGDYDARVLAAIRLYYDTNRIIGGLNPLPEASDPYLLGSHVSLDWMGLGHYSAQIDSAVARHGWYVMCNHSITPVCDEDPWCISVQMLSDVIDYARSKRVKIVNMDEAFDMMHPDQWAPGAGVVANGQTATTSPIQALRVSRGYRQVTIKYEVLNPTRLGIRIFDVRGRLVSALLDKRHGCGEHSIIWNGTDVYGRPVQAGIYFCEVIAGNTRECRKIQLIH
ncbi:MAG: polysaccharide deacetylase family protein [Candidatus Eisenbacteria bacterium]